MARHATLGSAPCTFPSRSSSRPSTFHHSATHALPLHELTAFGTVYRGRLNGALVAVKMLSRAGLNADNLARFKAEILLMTRFAHPNVIRILACAWEAPEVMLVLELAARGGLDALLHSSPGAPFALASQGLPVAIDVTLGLVYLHHFDPPVVHRDVKVSRAPRPPAAALRHPPCLPLPRCAVPERPADVHGVCQIERF